MMRAVPVTVTVLLFAALRERAGSAELEVTVPDGTPIDGIWPWLPAPLGRADAPSGVRYARNDNWAAPGGVLAGGDRIALVLPVSGG